MSSLRRGLKKARKLFGIKILTPNSHALKILQTTFAKPASVKAFRGMGEGGYPKTERIPKMELAQMRSPNARTETFLANDFEGSFPSRPFLLFPFALVIFCCETP